MNVHLNTFVIDRRTFNILNVTYYKSHDFMYEINVQICKYVIMVIT